MRRLAGRGRLESRIPGSTAALAFWITRALGRGAANRLVGDRSTAGLQRRLADNGTRVVFLLRVNPLTSSDLVSYAAGLTAMPLPKLLLGTALGMAPLCFRQAHAAESLFERWPWLIYPLALGIVGYISLAVWAWWLWRRRRPALRR